MQNYAAAARMLMNSILIFQLISTHWDYFMWKMRLEHLYDKFSLGEVYNLCGEVVHVFEGPFQCTAHMHISRKRGREGERMGERKMIKPSNSVDKPYQRE